MPQSKPDPSAEGRTRPDATTRVPGGADPDLVRTKIVATVGPACRAEEALRGLIQAGVDVFRLNMAHGSIEEHEETLGRIRRASDDLGRPVGVLVDLAGPKIRLGELPEGQVDCVEGARIRFVRGAGPSAADAFTTTYEPLVDELGPGDPVMLADGTVSLVVERREPALRGEGREVAGRSCGRPWRCGFSRNCSGHAARWRAWWRRWRSARRSRPWRRSSTRPTW